LIQERILQIEDGWLFVRHSELHKPRSVLLFVHGLGESGLCFKEAFESRDMNEYSLVVPDMMGYGRSSSSNRCSLTSRPHWFPLCCSISLKPVFS